MNLQIIRRSLLQLSWSEQQEKTSLWLAWRAGRKSFNEGLRLQPGSLQKQVAKLHFFTVTAVMVTTTPTCVTCGKQEEASFGITKRNGHFNYQLFSATKKKSYKLAALSKSFFLFFFCLTNSGFFAAVDLVFPWDEKKKILREKCFWKTNKSASKSIWYLKRVLCSFRKPSGTDKRMKKKKQSALMASANDTSVAQHLLTLFTKLSPLAVPRRVNPLGLLVLFWAWTITASWLLW